MRKIIIAIFLVLTFLCACSEKTETAADWISKTRLLWDGKQYTDPQKALEYLNHAIKLQPDSADAYNQRGVAYKNLGQNENAIKDYSEAIRLNPNDVLAYYNRGTVYNILRQSQNAIEDFNKALLLQPNTPQAYNNRGVSYLLEGKINLSCRDAKKACSMGVCKTLEFAKKKGYCR